MKKLFNFKKNKSLLNDCDNNSTYIVNIGKGILGLELELSNNKVYIIRILRMELENLIHLNDQLIKINNIDINNMSLEQIVELCSRIYNKNKKLEIMKSI